MRYAFKERAGEIKGRGRWFAERNNERARKIYG